MPNYVENGYSKNYVEGDISTPQNETTADTTPTQCDLSEVLKELKEIKTQNALLQEGITSLKDFIGNRNYDLKNEILEEIAGITVPDDLVNQSYLDSKFKNISTTEYLDSKFKNIATTEYLDSKVPFVDDKGVDVYPKGTAIISKISSGIFVVESSSFLPDGEGNYSVVYVVSKFSEKDNPKRVFSNMHSSYVKEVTPELYFKKESYPDIDFDSMDVE